MEFCPSLRLSISHCAWRPGFPLPFVHQQTRKSDSACVFLSFTGAGEVGSNTDAHEKPQPQLRITQLLENCFLLTAHGLLFHLLKRAWAPEPSEGP